MGPPAPAHGDKADGGCKQNKKNNKNEKRNFPSKKEIRGKNASAAATTRATRETNAKLERENRAARAAEEDVERETAPVVAATKTIKADNKEAEELLFFSEQ